MSYKKKSFAERIWAALLSVVLVITMLPVNAAAEEKISGVLSTDISEKDFTVGEATEFTFTTTANDDAGTMVIGSFEFSNPEAIEKLEYLESKDGQWYEFYGDFGPATGFPMSDATSTFRVTFKEAGNYTVTASMKTVEDGTVLCTTTANVTVKGIPSVLTTDIGEKVFQVGEATEFTFTTTANGDAGTMVLGTFEFSDPEAIEKLEYRESRNGEWYEFYGDFGPATGFPMSDATSTFRVTFKKAGSYTVNASMKTVEGGTVLCAATADVSVEHKVSVNVTANEGGSVSLNGDTSGTLTVDAGSAVLVDIKAEDGYQIAALNVGGAIIANAAGTTEFAVNTVVSRDVQVAVTFVKVWKVTVSYTGEGNVEMSPEGAEGNVIVETGTEVLIQANPKPHYHVEKVFINGVEEEFSSKNDAAYEKTLTADKEYTVEVTFAPNVYEIVIDQAEADKEKGSVASANAAVEYKGSNRITIEPKDGYTVDTVTVTDAATNEVVTVGAVTKESGSVYFDIPEIAANLKVSVTFKAEEVASADDLTITADDLRPLEEQLIVVRNGGNVTFTTEKEGIRIYSDDSILIGDETTQTVYVDATTAVTKVELYYQADGELYADWHVVGDLQPISIVVDAGNIEASLTPDSEANGNGYYNKDVAFKVYAEDMGDYSGLALVEYWITSGEDDNEVLVPKFELYKYEDNDDIQNVYENEFTVPASLDNGKGLKVKLHVIDRAENDMVIETELHINPVKPTVSMSIGGTQKDNAQAGYYDSDRKLTITITDRADTFSEVNATSGLNIEKNGTSIGAVEIEWTSSSENGVDTYVGTYTFTEDAHYTWSYSYTNLAGLSNDGISAENNIFDFWIDGAAPTDLKVTYDTPISKAVLGALSFGFYNPTVTVTIEATDDVAGIDHFAFSYKVDENVSSVNKGETDVILEGAEVKKGENNTYYATYDIPAQFRGKVSFTAVDKSGNTSEYNDGKIVVVDTIAPGVIVKYEPIKPQNGQYINKEIDATIFINEANFFGAEDLDKQLIITRTKKLNSSEEVITDYLKPDFVATGVEDEYKATIAFDENADYTFDITYTDRSGNTSASYEMDVFTIDTIAPIITGEKAEKEFYNEGRKVKFTVVEHNFDPAGFELNVQACDITGKEINLSSMDYANYLKDAAKWSKVEGQADTWEAVVPFEVEGIYTITATCVDKAGNPQELAFEDSFCIDKEAPANLKVTYDEKNFVEEFLDKLFYNPSVTVTIEATDEYAGVKSFVYSYTVEDDASNVNSGLIKQEVPATRDGNTNRFYATFDIPAQFRGMVSFSATDNSENTSTIYEDGRVVVVDNIAPGIRVEYESEEPEEGEYFNHDIKADVYIKEANFFGTEKWEFADLEEYLIITRTKVLNNGKKVTEQLKPEFKATGVEDEYAATLLFDEDADYSFSIDYTDHSGNKAETYQSVTFTVDKTAPVIDVEYKTPEEPVDGYYYAKNRTAIVTVVEHNFNLADFVLEVNATDVNGNEIDLSSMNYADYLKDATKWTGIGLNTWQAEIPFTIEGHYTVEVTCKDMAGNTEEKAFKDEFCLDKTAPANLKILYETDPISELIKNILDALLDGKYTFYNPSVKVTIEATDEYAGVEKFVYSYAVSQGTSSINSGLIDEEVEATQVEGTNKFYATFDIPAQFRGNVSFEAYDKSTNSAAIKDEDVEVVVDTKKPEITVSYDHNNAKDDEYCKYYNVDRTATITIKEANFYGDADYNERLLVITRKKVFNDGTEVTEELTPEFTATGVEDEYAATVKFDENADYTLTVEYKDRSGNVADTYQSEEFTVDKIAPTISVSYNDEGAKFENDNQFRTTRKATITIVEHNFNAKDVDVNVTASGYEGVQYFDYIGHLTNPDNWLPCTCDECKGDKPAHQDIHIAEIPFEVEAHYTFDISYTDMAGNDNVGVDYGNSVAPNEFTVDTTAPTELNIQVVNDSVNESVNDPVENTENGEKDTLVFDKFYSKAVTVKLSANCDISGLDNLRYQKVVEVADYKEDGTWTEYDAENGIEVLPTEKFIIYFRAEDRAGNYTIIRSTGIVVDNKMPIGEKRAPEIDIFPDGANALHASSVDVDLKVVEPAYIGEEVNAEGFYSGIKQVSYRIYASDLNMEESGELLVAGNSGTDGDIAGVVRDKDGLIKSFSTRITVGAQFNSNNVVVEITAVDNAGNTRTTSTGVGEIQIDTTAPSIDVSYDNNNADGDVFFSANRVAQITIAERNFNGDDVNVNITNTDGVIPTVSTWYETAGTGNGDDTRWTAIIEYNVDGDYTFEISYTDLAGNAFNSLTYAPDTVAPEVFTIDKTIPVIDVTYNNNQAMNSNYYDAERTATVRVREHNFNAERVEIVMTATNDGKAAATPAVSAWIANGDEYTAVIRYAADALYTFDIAVRDNAGNEAADFAQQSFYIDQTMPLLTITGVKDKSANNGSVVPVVTYSDTNFDPNQVMITLTGANRKQVVLDGTYSNIHNGKVFTFADFANEKEMDDIYTLTATLTDKAGNTSTETILFSVNRFGSTYMIDESVEKLNGTYVQEPQDIVITEVNPNELNNIQITLFKNNETLILKEGSDYKIDIQGKEGEWYRYTYTIFKENFADDGVYRLSLYSEDAAGNVAQNTLDTKNVEINFGVDKTKPNIVVENLESGITYAVEGMTAKLSVSDNLILNSVMVYLDDLKDPYKTWTAEEIAQINVNGGEFEFEISGDSTSAHEVKIVSADVAGNEQITEISDFYVTTNLLVRYVNNKPLLYGSIAGMVLAIGVTVLLIINGKEKRK